MKFIAFILSCCVVCLLFLTTAPAPSHAQELGSASIGWATADITPSLPAPLRGQFHKRISKYVRDPLSATVLALESKSGGGKPEQVIMVSCDQVSIPSEIQDRVRGRVRETIPDFDGTRLFLNATHTHTAPSPIKTSWYDTSGDPGIMTEPQFAVFIVERIADAVARAWKNRAPGGISWGLGHAVVGHNRRAVYSDGTAVMYGNTDTERFMKMEGPSDHGVEMLFTWDAAGNFTGVVLNVACPSQVVESEYYISADFWAEVRKELRSRYSPDLFILPQCGAAGDQSPRDLPRRRRGEPDMRGEAGLVEIGKRLANAVEYVYPAARNAIKNDIVLKHAVVNINLPVRQVSMEEYQEAYAVYATYEKLQQSSGAGPDFSTELGRTMGAKKAIVDRYRSQGKEPYLPFELHAVRIGDIAIANNPFELYLDYGLRMKARSVAEQTFVVQLSGDDAGYLPTREAIAGGGYSTYIYSTQVGPDGGDLLVEETVKLINSLWE